MSLSAQPRGRLLRVLDLILGARGEKGKMYRLLAAGVVRPQAQHIDEDMTVEARRSGVGGTKEPLPGPCGRFAAPARVAEGAAGHPPQLRGAFAHPQVVQQPLAAPGAVLGGFQPPCSVNRTLSQRAHWYHALPACPVDPG